MTLAIALFILAALFFALAAVFAVGLALTNHRLAAIERRLDGEDGCEADGEPGWWQVGGPPPEWGE